jgi:hypothetical protein
MGRSVSRPYNSEVVVFLYPELDVFTEDDKYDEYLSKYNWDNFVIDLEEVLKAKYKSLTKCSKWLGNEDHAFLENELVYVGLSEHCGVVAVWIVPKFGEFYTSRNEKANLAVNFCKQIEKGFEKLLGENYGTRLNRVGTFSNGETVYERVV